MRYSRHSSYLLWACLVLLTALIEVEAGETPSLANPAMRVIGSNKILFVDLEYLETGEGVALKLHPPRKMGERLIVTDQPWESATLNWFTVLKDGDKYRMWYECYDVDGWPTSDDTSFCYAESPDGIQWTKPSLGLVSYQGSTDNNILFRQIGGDQHRSRVHGSCVFIDPSAPEAERYKCVSQGLFQGIGDRPYYVAGMTSPDGLHWTRRAHPICMDFADSQYSGFWDETRREYVLYGRTSGRGGRAIGRAASSRFDAFPPLAEQTVLQVHEDDPSGCDLYNPACQMYPGVPGLYLMFPSLFRHQEDTLEVRLAVSRDGVRWTWPERETAFLPLGHPGDFDGGSLYLGNGAGVLTGEEMSFYFSGSALKHEQVDLPQLKNPMNQRVISRAVAPRDRLVSVTAPASGGKFQTPLLQYAGHRLVVNAVVHPGGMVRFGLLDAEGKPIAGHSVEECSALPQDNLAWGVSWDTGADVATWSDQPVRLQVELRDADLFGFQFVSE